MASKIANVEKPQKIDYSTLNHRALLTLTEAKRYRVGDSLYLRVRSVVDDDDTIKYTRRWVYRWRDKATGKLREYGLGGFPKVKKSDAKAQGYELQMAVRAGRDPIAERRTERAEAKALAGQIPTFAECCFHLRGLASSNHPVLQFHHRRDRPSRMCECTFRADHKTQCCGRPVRLLFLQEKPDYRPRPPRLDQRSDNTDRGHLPNGILPQCVHVSCHRWPEPHKGTRRSEPHRSDHPIR